MLGAIIGDIVGSRFEWHNYRAKDFEFLPNSCFFTDDSVMSLAVAKALLDTTADRGALGQKTIEWMQYLGTCYPNAGYGGHFALWLREPNPQPYHSFGNGAAMRISAVGIVAKDVEEAKALSKAVTAVTHDHAEGIKGAESVAVAIVLAKKGKSMKEIHDYITREYYPIDFTIEGIRRNYSFDVTSQGTVPQAFEAFFESKDFEDAIRIAISVGGDSDTLAAITGGMAEAYYGIPDDLRRKAKTFLAGRLLAILEDFEDVYPPFFS